MSDASDTVQQTSTLIREIGQLKGGMFFGLGVITVLALAIVALWLVLRHRERRNEQDAAENSELRKDQRAAQNAAALDSLAETIRQQMSSSTESMTYIQHGMSALSSSVTIMEQTVESTKRHVDQILDRQNGVMTVEQSCGVVEQFFFSVVVEKAFGLIAISLLNDSYDTRKDFVEEAIKTDIARVLYDVRATLKNLPLAIPVDNFFTKVDGEGERFVFCDEVWEAVVHLYQTQNVSAKDRISALRYKILNAVKDYFIDRRQLACAPSTGVIKKTDAYKKHPSSAAIKPL